MSLENPIPTTSELAPAYERHRSLRTELRMATIQREMATSEVSSCREIAWQSFGESCETYHSFFPTAEILGLVSSPRHHPELFIDTLKNSVKSEKPLVWIPATATPRLYDMTRFALPNAGILVTDICKTPVVSIALSFQNDVNRKQLAGRDLNLLEAEFDKTFDAIVVDALLTRFNSYDRIKALRVFYRALKPDGVLLTTVRIPKEGEDEQKQTTEKESDESLDFVDKVIETYRETVKSAGNPDMIPYPSEDYLRADANEYRSKMKSNHARNSKDRIYAQWMPLLNYVPNMGAINMEIMNVGFMTSHNRISREVYDISTRKYLQIAAIK